MEFGKTFFFSLLGFQSMAGRSCDNTTVLVDYLISPNAFIDQQLMSTMSNTCLPSKLTASSRTGMRADGAAITASCQDPSRLFSSTGLP